MFTQLLVTKGLPQTERIGLGGKTNVKNAITLPYDVTLILESIIGVYTIIGAYTDEHIYVPYDTPHNQGRILAQASVCRFCMKQIKLVTCTTCRCFICTVCGNRV